MMTEEEKKNFQEQLNMQQQALAKIYKSVEKTRKYMLWSGIVSLAMFVIPLIIVAVMLPKIMSTFTGALGGLGGGEVQVGGANLEESLNLLRDLGI